jgi:hypothetical protein
MLREEKTTEGTENRENNVGDIDNSASKEGPQQSRCGKTGWKREIVLISSVPVPPTIVVEAPLLVSRCSGCDAAGLEGS